MRKIFDKIFSMKLAIVFLLVFAFFAGLATIIESVHDTPTAWAKVYGAGYFGLIQLYLGFNITYNIWKFGLFKSKKLPSFIFHFSFILILLGAILTRFLGFEGQIHIREGESSSEVLSQEDYITLSSGEFSADLKKSIIATGDNSFTLELPIDEKKAVLSLNKYIEVANLGYQERSNAKPIIGVIFSNDQYKREIVFKEGEEIDMAEVLVSFNRENLRENYINFSLKDGKFYLQTDQNISYFDPAQNAENNVTKGVLFELNKPVIFNLDGINFATSFMYESGEMWVKEVENGNGSSALVFDLNYDGQSREIYAFYGTNGHKFDLAGKEFTVNWGPKSFMLPFELKLKDFIMDRYPGSNSPSGYKSVVDVVEGEEAFEAQIYMNHVLDHKGFRFFQSSYDKDELGTILSVNRDPGKIPTYLGYFLLALGMFLNVFNPNSRFRKLSNLIDESASRRAPAAILFLALIFSNLPLNADELVTLDANHLKNLNRIVVQGADGRMQPFDTIALDVLHKISGKDTVKTATHEFSPTEMLISALLDPKSWQEIPVIKIRNEELNEFLGIEKTAKFAKFADFFAYDDDNKSYYKLQKISEEISRKPAGNRSMFDKEVLKVDERFNVLNMVFFGEFFRFIPKLDDPQNTWYSPIVAMQRFSGDEGERVATLLQGYFTNVMEASQSGDWTKADEWLNLIKEYQNKIGANVVISEKKVDFELFFNKFQIFKKLIGIYLIAGFLLLIAVFLRIQKPNLSINFAFKAIYAVNILAFVLHTFGLAIRWYISGHAPWSNAYESLVYIAWSLSLSGMIFSRRSALSLALTSILAGVTLFVANLSSIDPQITNIMPVLNSYWLTIHVSVITASYGFLGLCSLLGMFSLLLFILKNDKNAQTMQNSITEATRINEMAMILGLCLLTVGNFLGGVWANESWGRYWGWDSKETWSLVTILIYSAILHIRFWPKFNSQYYFAVFSMFGYLSVLMTYFGVNFYLTGMHSYAAGEAVPIPKPLYIGLFVMFGLSAAAFFKRKFAKKL